MKTVFSKIFIITIVNVLIGMDDFSGQHVAPVECTLAAV